MNEISIRRAWPEDSIHCARLILASAEKFLPAVFGPHIKEALTHLAAASGNLFSHSHAWIAETKGKSVGMLLGYTEREKAAENPRTGFVLLRCLGFSMIRRLGRLLRLQITIGRIPVQGYYISNLAVYPEFRGRGIGSTLISRAHQEALEKGCSLLLLDVEIDNEAAIRLYSRLGFTTRGHTRPIVLSDRPFSLDRMEKPLI
jgi:ribosomal protein S18 acetylase RimI-like enzyme